MSITTPRLSGMADRFDRDRPQRSTSLFWQKKLYLSLVLHRPEEGLRAANAGPRFESRLRVPSITQVVWAKSKPGCLKRRAKIRHIGMPFNSVLGIRGLGLWLFALASSDIGLGHFDDAIDECHRAIDAGLRTFPAYAILATAYAMTNRIDEAKAAAAVVGGPEKLNPKLTVKNITPEALSENSAVTLKALRRAGLPEE